MKRCTACFRYSLSDPPFCSHCGRSYLVRLCPRGHQNGRGAQFCAECGSGDLSTPAPPATWLFTLAEVGIRLSVGLAIGAVILVVVAALWFAVDWQALVSRLVGLAVLVAIVYWASTLLPGPVRKVGKAAWKASGARRKANSRDH